MKATALSTIELIRAGFNPLDESDKMTFGGAGISALIINVEREIGLDDVCMIADLDAEDSLHIQAFVDDKAYACKPNSSQHIEAIIQVLQQATEHNTERLLQAFGFAAL